MRNLFRKLAVALLMFSAALSLSAQERRPIDSQHPLWLVHIDVWNSADPQKIIDLIPDDIKPYVCMNLSLSCQYDKDLNMYRMPRCAVRTYKSWASVCQANNMWFTCQPASGGHTHIQDDDLETFEYFFKAYPNFLGWNYAEQFWGFDEAGDESSSSQASRIALFAKLVPMHHQYGGFLTISFCGNIWSHGLNPMGMMKRNKNLLQACKDYPEACVWLYKYTTSSCWYANESVTWGPFVSGLAKNYGVRYDNCGWNGALDAILGEGHGKKYPGAAGIGTVMEQTCVNGGAVWDGPELIWTEDFQNQNNTTVDGYTRRNWGTFPNFRGVWMDMFRQIINGHLYIPTREEVVGNIKIAIQNDVTSGSDENKYAVWGSLYDGLYKQTDPFNRGNGQWMDNLCYFKKTGRYGTIPLVIGYYDDIANSIPVKKKKSSYASVSQTTKVNEFNKRYPEVSKGDLFVNRYRNHLVTYTPYSYLNEKKTAKAAIPLHYNTCDSLKLTYARLSSGHIREYADRIEFYLNNFRSDSTAQRTDTIVVVGATSQPTAKIVKHGIGSATMTKSYNEETGTFTLNVKHYGPADVIIECAGAATDRLTDILPVEALPIPQQPESYVGPIVIEAENMDYKNVKNVALTHSGWCAPDYSEFAGMGYVEMGTTTTAALRHQLNLQQGGDYDIYIRYCNTSKAGNIKVTVNGTANTVACEKVAKNDWRKVKVSAPLNEGTNDLVITNTGGTGLTIDQIIYMPADMEAEKFLITVRQTEQGTVTPNVNMAAEGDTVIFTVAAEDGYQLKELRLVNSIYYTMGKTIKVDGARKVTFIMPDDNVTLEPVYEEAGVIAKLDFQNVIAGAIPTGWRCVQGGNEVHEYPNIYSQGARTMVGFSGYQGKGLYWRENSAEFGRQSAYPLTLEKGDYILSYAMAAWKGTPKYQLSILDYNAGTAIATTTTFTASPNVNGNSSASVASATLRKLEFSVSKEGNYVISFTDPSGGFDEYLLLECTLRKVEPANPCDVNGDGNVDVADIASIITFMAASSSLTLADCDTNGDGQVDVADIATVISAMAAAARSIAQ
ncbi:MAG: glycosyl hydrolase family 98 [Prevotella sp.]|nr:glycosyl hydrolase family 98 [Prevotella sp.]